MQYNRIIQASLTSMVVSVAMDPDSVMIPATAGNKDEKI